MDLTHSDIQRIADFVRTATKAPSLEAVISETFSTLKNIAEVYRIRIVYAPTPALWTEWLAAGDALEVRSHKEFLAPEKRAMTAFFDPENDRSGFMSAVKGNKKVRSALDILAPEVWSALTLHTALARAQKAAISESELVRATLRARDEERRHIARELHDDLSQSLVSLKLALKVVEDVIENANEGKNVAIELRGLRQNVGTMLEKVRDLSHTLYPRILDSLGLLAAVKELTHQVSRHSNMTIECLSRGNPVSLGKEIEVALYRCCQAAITNALRHSGASKVQILIDFAEGEVRVSVEDDGKGFDPRALYDSNSRIMGSGFWTIRQRMADLEGAFRVSTAEGRGTVVEMIVPYFSRKAHERGKDKTTSRR